MAVRALWIFPRTETKQDWQINYSKRYSIIEKRARKLAGENYEKISRDDKIIIDAILQQLGLGSKTSKVFLKNRDSCDNIPRVPVIEVFVKNVILWPLLVIEHREHILCCLPLVENNLLTSSNVNSLFEIESISTAFSILTGIQSFLGDKSCKPTEIIHKLDNFLSFSMPLGRPGELEPSLINAAMTTTPPPSDIKQNIIPKKHQNQNSSVKLTEFIRAIQYNKPDVKNVIEVYGNLTWIGVLEPFYTEVMLNLSSISTSINVFPLQLVGVHPCVFNIDQDPSMTTRKLRFKPNLNTFPICYYTVKMKNFPISGSFSMSCNEKHVDLIVSLKLENGVNNYFRKFEVLIPFFDRIISSYELKPSWGSISPSKDLKNVTWLLRDSKFPGHDVEISLKGSVVLSGDVGKDDVVRFMSEAFVGVYFEIEDYSFSGVCVDSKSIQTSVPTSGKISSKKRFVSVDYKLWNENGDVPVEFCQKLVSEPSTPLI